MFIRYYSSDSELCILTKDWLREVNINEIIESNPCKYGIKTIIFHKERLSQLTIRLNMLVESI